MANEIKRPGIPALDHSVDPKVRKAIAAIKENIEISNGQRGHAVGDVGWLRRSVSLNMLIKLGLITEEQARSVSQEL